MIVAASDEVIILGIVGKTVEQKIKLSPRHVKVTLSVRITLHFNHAEGIMQYPQDLTCSFRVIFALVN